MTVDVARIAFSQKEHRSVVSEDAAVKVRHPLAIELTYTTLLKNEADALTFGQSVLDLRKLDRWTWASLINSQAHPDLEIGMTVTLFHTRFGLQNGKNFIVKRLKTIFGSPFYEVNLYGPQ